MRWTGLKVNDVPKIHIKSQNLTNESHCIVSTDDGTGTELLIKMQLGVTFSYFPTQEFTQEEIDNCEYIKTVYLTPDAAEWDTYDEDYSERDDASFNFRGDLIDFQPKQRRLLDYSDIYELQVSQEIYEYTISSIVANNDTWVFTLIEENNPCSNPQQDDMDFIRDDDYMQSEIANLTAYFNE